MVHQLVQKNEHDYPSAIAIIHENQKYFVCDSNGNYLNTSKFLENFGTFLGKVQKADDSLEVFILDHLNCRATT